MCAPKTTQLKRHAQREDLTGEHPLGDAGQIVFALLFGGTWIIDSVFLKFSTQLNNFVPALVRIPIGVVLCCLSIYCARAGLRIVFGEVRQTPAVIRKGIFGVVRHPVYLSEILLYLGLFIISMSLAAGVILLGTAAFLHSISRHEERLLLERFGDDYRAYLREVGMWVPRFTGSGRHDHG